MEKNPINNIKHISYNELKGTHNTNYKNILQDMQRNQIKEGNFIFLCYGDIILAKLSDFYINMATY